MRPVSRCGLRLANSCRFSSSSSSSFVRFTSPAIRASIGQRSTASPHAVAGRQSDEGKRAGDGTGSGDHDLTDLNLRGEVGVVGDITHDLLAVGTDALLEVGGGIEVEMTGGHEGRRRCPAPREALVDLVAKHAVALEA